MTQWTPGSSAHGILQGRGLDLVAIPFSGDLLDPGIEPRFSALQADFLMFEPPGKPKYFYFLRIFNMDYREKKNLLMVHFILRLKVCSESTTFKSYLGLFPFPLFSVIIFFIWNTVGSYVSVVFHFRIPLLMLADFIYLNIENIKMDSEVKDVLRNVTAPVLFTLFTS